MERSSQNKAEAPKPIALTDILSDILRGIKKLWWIGLLLITLCAAGSWFAAKRAYRPLYRAFASFTVATGSGESGGFNYGFYYNTATASQLVRTFPYILESELMADAIAQKLGTNAPLSTLSASAVEDSNLFTVTSVSSDAADALRVLEAAIACYPDAARYVLGNIELHVLRAPVLPTEPYNRFDGRQAILIGGGYGALAAAVLVFFYVCTRRTIRKEDEISAKLHLPCLGVLPKVTFKRRSGRQTTEIQMHDPHVPEAYREAVRGLAMRLTRYLSAKGGKTLLFCGTLPGEGVHTAASAVAYTLGEAGQTVILLDLDFRRAAKSRAAGLENCLLADTALEDCLYRREKEPYLRVSCSRALSVRETLAAGEKLQNVIDALRAKADILLITAPESARFSEILPVSEQTDAAVYVILEDFAGQTRIKSGLEKLFDADIPVAGCVLNGAQMYFSGYGYGYGKYGYYRYGKYGKYGKYGGHYGAWKGSA